jgi:hypothetical protein
MFPNTWQKGIDNGHYPPVSATPIHGVKGRLQPIQVVIGIAPSVLNLLINLDSTKLSGEKDWGTQNFDL